MVGYHFPTDDLQASTDNDSVFATEVVEGYLGAGLVALDLNHTKYDFESGWKDWRRSLVRSTVLSLASATIVYAIGEKYGSGKGRFVDSLKDSLYAPIGIGFLPCVVYGY